MDISAEHLSYDRFAEYVRKQNRFGQDNISLYHYTSLEAMVKILDSKSLWATNCQYMNDILEARHIKMIFDNLAQRYKGYELLFINKIKELYNSEIYQNIIDKAFIISFTREYDSVAMWRNYGKNGIIIEFDASFFYKHKHKKETSIICKSVKTIKTAKMLMDVIYDSLMIEDCFGHQINLIIKDINLDNINKSYIVEQINNLSYLFLLSFLFKDLSYSYESETRMVLSLEEDKDIGTVEKYRIKNSLVIPYLDVSFEENENLPIKSIRINPEQNDVMFRKSIERLLKSYSYDIPVYKSERMMRY